MKMKKLPSISVLPLLWNRLFLPRDREYYKWNGGIITSNLLLGFSTLFPKEKAVYMNIFGYKVIFFIHPESAKEVLKSNNLINKDSTYDFFIPVFGKNTIFYSADDNWRKRRRYLAPYFHLWNLKNHQNVLMEYSSFLVEKLKKLQQSEIFNVLKWMKYCTLDIAADVLLGISLMSQSENYEEYITALDRYMRYYPVWLLNPLHWFPPIFARTKTGRNFKRHIEIIHQFGEKVFKKIKENYVKRQLLHLEDNAHSVKEPNIKPKPLIDLLLDLHVNQGLLSEKDIIKEMVFFMFAAFDTTAHVMSWSLYFLGRFHEIQDKVYLELQSIFENDMNRNITVDDLLKMTYLECVIKESMRICPPVPVIARKNPYEIKIDDYILPPKSFISICIHAIHHNHSVYENPELFDPDRFLPENFKKLHPYGFLPFSAGPRNCLGFKLAMVEMKTILANVLRNFKVYSLDPQEKIVTSAEVLLRPISGIRMRVEKR
ncbi:cytochrome P450 4C1-like [Centruroides sculpturatus]|uniref:cytochrome P450 4C1-like n=1 Tax=Centruroides sculpturatus TaxID=218467 RepID=UPI000C6DBE84|nr:cytochrome P450 4C1-like [Centruroides sculpturatus]